MGASMTRTLALAALLLCPVPAFAGAGCGDPPQITIQARPAALPVQDQPTPAETVAGLYSARVAAAYSLLTEGQGPCPRVTAATVTLTHAARIEIGPQHRATCRTAIIAEHEAAHAEADARALAAATARMERDLPQLFAPPITPAAAHEALALYLTSAGDRYARERDAAHALIDSPAAMAHAVAAGRRCTNRL